MHSTEKNKDKNENEHAANFHYYAYICIGVHTNEFHHVYNKTYIYYTTISNACIIILQIIICKNNEILQM